MGGSFCYWLNCWPSLFKLSFHNFSYIVLLLLTVNQLILQRMGFHLFVIYNKYNFKTNLMAFIFKLWSNREYSHIFLKYLIILLFSFRDQTRSSSIIFVFVFQLFLFDLFLKNLYNLPLQEHWRILQTYFKSIYIALLGTFLILIDNGK